MEMNKYLKKNDEITRFVADQLVAYFWVCARNVQNVDKSYTSYASQKNATWSYLYEPYLA